VVKILFLFSIQVKSAVICEMEPLSAPFRF